MSATCSDFSDSEEQLTSEQLSLESCVTDEESEDDTATANATVSSNIEFRREYTELIGAVDEFTLEDGLEQQKEMNKNIKRSKTVFESFEGNTGASEMYMACFHTKKCSEIVKGWSDKIGNDYSRFRLDKFLQAVKKSYTDGISSEEYSKDSTIENVLHLESTSCAKTAPTFSGIRGLFNRETFSVAPAAPAPKAAEQTTVKTPRAPRKKRDFDQTNATQHTVVNLTEEQRTATDTSAVKISMDLLHMLHAHNRQHDKPVSLYEFAMDKSSMSKTIENIFYVAFLIRDGHASLTKEGLANLMLKPETPPEKGDSVEREQHILSISSNQWRNLAKASRGDNMIAPRHVDRSKYGKSTAGTSKSQIATSSPESPEMTPKRKKLKK